MASVGVLDRIPRVTEQDSPAVALCRTVLGADLTAYVVGAESREQFESWLVDPAAATPYLALRMAAAVELIDAFATCNQVSLAGPWLSDVGADGRVPARLLRGWTGDESLLKTLQAGAMAAAAAAA
jgi:hypothetical protein